MEIVNVKMIQSDNVKINFRNNFFDLQFEL